MFPPCSDAMKQKMSTSAYNNWGHGHPNVFRYAMGTGPYEDPVHRPGDKGHHGEDEDLWPSISPTFPGDNSGNSNPDYSNYFASLRKPRK